MRSYELEPRPAILIESMRDIGYSLETALADIVDNSISAGAINIRIRLDPACEQPCIGIIDDGCGMTREELLEAMRPGSRSPLEERSIDDLGRFGLGLKTASFSQCRRLTVVSRDGSGTCAMRWDLDHVVSTNAWLVQEPEGLEDVPYVAELGERGTLVVWENMDRVCAPGDGEGLSEATRRLDDACRHIELVFHRFLAGERPLQKVCMFVNGTKLKPHDPFCAHHPATIAGPVEVIRAGDADVEVQAFTLPHHSKVSQDDWDRTARREGYVKNQGFYVYRAKRLIINGTWFGLLRQSELTKLARVRVDTPNSLDMSWKIDVKKASAQPPRLIRRRLGQIVDKFVSPSKRVYTVRGTRQASDERCPTWLRVAERGEVRYEINFEHPMMTRLQDGLDSESGALVRAMLKMIQAAIPIDAIHADANDGPKGVTRPNLEQDDLRSLTKITFERLLSNTGNRADAMEFMQSSEPFASQWPAVAGILEQLS